MFYRYFMKVLDSVNEDQNEVELTADGSWKVPEEKQHNKGNFCHRMGGELSHLNISWFSACLYN